MTGSMATGTATATDTGTEHSVLVVGGSADHLGGVEAFCERSAVALHARGGWRLEHIPASTAYMTMARLPAYLRGLRQLTRYRRNRPDIVWIQYVNLPDLGYLIVARLLGMRTMVTPHLGVFWRSQGNPVLRWLSELILRRAHRIALISKTQELEIALPRKVPRSLIANFLPHEVLTGPLADAAALPPVLQIIHSSRLSEEKGSFMVLEVCRQLRDAGVPFRTRITGTGSVETMERMHELVTSYELGDCVEVLGRVPEQELLDHLRGSDILVHLSSVDSYPLIILEGMACSVLPVVLELAGARDMVETYGGHVVQRHNAVGDTVEWIKGCDLAVLRSNRTTMANRVRADYAWERCSSALAAALTACLTDTRN